MILKSTERKIPNYEKAKKMIEHEFALGIISSEANMSWRKIKDFALTIGYEYPKKCNKESRPERIGG